MTRETKVRAKSTRASKSIEPYAQFPLAIFSMGLEFRELLRHVAHFSFWFAGRAYLRQSDPADRERFKKLFESQVLERCPPWTTVPDVEGFEEAFAFFVGTRLFSYKTPNIDECLRQVRAVKEHVRQIGNRCYVRLKFQILYGVLKSSSLNEREFKILCAIYSAIGTQDFAWLTRKQISRRACGYANRFQFEQLSIKEEWTEAQIKWTLTQLERAHFFARVTIFKRRQYFSHKLNRKQLRKAVCDELCAEENLRVEQSRLDGELSREILRRRQGNRPKIATADGTEKNNGG